MKKLDSFPRVPLGIFPTPIQKLENVSRLLNTNVYVKRDDLTGIGLGGNKVLPGERLFVFVAGDDGNAHRLAADFGRCERLRRPRLQVARGLRGPAPADTLACNLVPRGAVFLV